MMPASDTQYSDLDTCEGSRSTSWFMFLLVTAILTKPCAHAACSNASLKMFRFCQGFREELREGCKELQMPLNTSADCLTD
jgi:hypothetical protein